ncbi:carbohydrate ABC transporter permease [Sulfoacidibacillus thermotolerans]|uniref:ABC transmembrane type-1 domain-containing protein n=1 Tax=Sulfoacidibacillus thermotolerans TaxID=1765684 RepID=A0A2U3D969_SULT2|nr:carbohydrate ABC transporter permease [Sulfoacidibacillus thermotolerans]PWI57832.1 hypothetical protein BM613_06495 [Sulfoacidibacillus thermotolerans]
MGTPPNVMKFIVLAGGATLFCIPLWWMINTSLLANQQVFMNPPQFFPLDPQWKNFLIAWRQPDFARYLANSLFVAFAIVLGQLITSSLAAYAIARVPFRGKRIAYALILTTFMIPVQVTFIPMFLMMRQLNWIDTYQALIVPFLGSAFATFWLVQAFRQVPQLILDAAQIDGASHWWILWRIVLPLCKPSLLAVAFLNFVFHFNDLFWPLISTQSNTMRTIPVGLTYMVATDGSGTAWTILMASSLLATLPTLLLFIAGQKYFIQSNTHAGLKE